MNMEVFLKRMDELVDKGNVKMLWPQVQDVDEEDTLASQLIYYWSTGFPNLCQKTKPLLT